MKLRDTYIGDTYKSLKKYIFSEESLLGGIWGATVGGFWSLFNHCDEYSERLHTVQSLKEEALLNLEFFGKSLDEMIIGALAGMVAGALVKSMFTRRRQR
jgi:uncharacterized membrane protein YeaQ/YmgE (transglycosylase-associated protein family)